MGVSYGSGVKNPIGTPRTILGKPVKGLGKKPKALA